MIRTILVTDDNVLDNAILRNYLYNERFNMISAVNGVEALELLEGRNIDLILLDLIMPVMDGFEFLKNIAKTHYYTEIPIIVTSSLSNATDIEKVFNYNIFDYIIKPLDNLNKKILVNKIRKAISYRDILKENAQLRREIFKKDA